MPRQLTNKQVVVLELLREGELMTAQRIADTITERTTCAHCGGSGQGDSRWGCRPCYGRGKAMFHYSHAYQALQRLVRDGLVVRESILDPWGDPTGRIAYRAAPVPAADDPLEAIWRAS